LTTTARKPHPATTTPPTPKKATHKTVIVAHPTRKHWADQLGDTLGAYIEMDPGRLGCTRNHINAWQHHHNHTTLDWALVIEDDALPIPDFATQTALALGAAPTPIVSLYLGRQRPPQHQPTIMAAVKNATENHHAWITSPTLYHCVAVAIRTSHLGSLVRFIDHNPYCHLDIDEAITEWARYHNHLIAYTQPSLVDHRDQGTIAKHRDGAPRETGRTAYQTGPRDDWHTDATPIIR
jgi:hypothetical protein